ncbi:MAG: prolyl aminopeptidase [Thermomicrobiales bacterium]
MPVDPRYSTVEPYATGMLDVGDGNMLFWEVSGNPDGVPVVVLHGGPGSGSTAGTRRYFDPAHYRIVQFDQRNCGRSTPHASEPDIDLSATTMDAMVADIERLRGHLGVEHWLVFGASWGSVLGLTYAERHPKRVMAMVIFAVATGRRAETDLLTRGLGAFFPDSWERYRSLVPPEERDGDLAAAYNRLLFDADPAVREAAARAWCDWEDAILPTAPPSDRYNDPRFRMAFARLVTHVWMHGSWLEEGEVIANAGRLAGIPGVLIEGSLDFGNLLGTPWLVQAAWPGSELILINDAGHNTTNAMATAIVTAMDRFRTLLEDAS